MPLSALPLPVLSIATSSRTARAGWLALAVAALAALLAAATPAATAAATWLPTPGTALGFLGLSVGGWALQRGARRAAVLLAGSVLAGATLSLVFHMFPLLTEPWPLSVLPLPLAAFALVLLALAVTLLAWPDGGEMGAQGARATAGVAAGVALLMAADQAMQPWPRAFPGAMLDAGTGGLAVACAIAVLLAARSRSPSAAQRRVDRYAAWVPAILAGLAFLAWLQLEELSWRERASDTELARDALVRDIGTQLKLRADALQRLAQRWRVYPEPTREQFEQEAAMYLRDFDGLHAVVFTDPQLVVRWRLAREDSGHLIGRSLAADDGRMEAFVVAAGSDVVRLTPTVQLRSGGVGFALVAPVRVDGQLRGFLTTSVRASEVLDILGSPLLGNFSMVLRDDGVVLARTGSVAEAAASLRRGIAFNALGRPWAIEVWPNRQYLARIRSHLPETAFLLGLAAVALVMVALLQARRSLGRAVETQTIAARLAHTLESITDAFYTLDADWRFAYLNREAERLLHRSRDELLGRTIWEVFPGAAASATGRQFRRAFERQETVAFEEYYPPEKRWLGVRAYPANDGLAVYFQDVTELIQGRRALRESERELRALAESMPQMVWMADPEGRVTYLNQRWVDYTGCTLDESRGDGWARCLEPGDRVEMRRAWQRAREGGTYFSTEARMRRVDGAWRWMLVRAVPFRSPAGGTTKWMGTCTDIDDLKRAAEAVQASEERFRLLSRATHDAVLDWQPGAGFLWWNEGFELLFGHSEQTMARTFDAWLELVHPEEQPAVREKLERALHSGEPVWTLQHRFQRAGGQWAQVRTRGYVIRDAAGRAERMLASMSDVSGQAALEEQLRQLQRLESLGQLTGGVAHDFNNLLTVLLGNAEVLAESVADPGLQQLARVMVSAAERGADLTQRLLAFARKQTLQPVPVDLTRSLDELVPMLQRTLGEIIDIEVQTDASLWPAMVDPGQLANAVLNLCLNARDAMPSGGTLRLQARNVVLDAAYAESHPEARAGDYVLLAVADTGVGIAPHVLARVFEPFFTTKEKGTGTGLGLPMVYGFILQSGGHVAIDSQPGVGTTVRVYLPRAAQPMAPEPERLPRPLPRGDEAVLLVEDDPLVRQYAASQLRALGYRVTEAARPDEALQLLRGGLAPDLLFTDVIMPGLSGPQLAAAARELHPRLKVLYVSGYTDDALARHGQLASGVELLHKPYRQQDLARRIRLVLEQERSPRSP